MALDINDKRVQLAGAFGRTIQQFTTHTPMPIEDLLDALTFTAGHALAQKSAQQFSTKKRLREIAIAALDRGITEGSTDRTRGPQLFIAPRRAN